MIELQKIQDIIAKFALTPLKIYKLDEDMKIAPITQWSNRTFLHWVQDTEDFPKVYETPAPDFTTKSDKKLASLLKKRIESSIKEKIGDILKSKFKIHKFSLCEDSGPYYFIMPIINYEKDETIDYLAISGGFYFGEREFCLANTDYELKLDRYERKVLIEELSELPLYGGQNEGQSELDNRMQSIRRTLSAFISYFSDNQEIILKENDVKNLIGDLYRFCYKENLWKRITCSFKNAIEKDPTSREMFGDILGLVISLRPWTGGLKSNFINGLGFAKSFNSKYDKGRETVYLYNKNEEGNLEFYFNFNFEIPPEDKLWEINNWREWIKKKNRSRVIGVNLQNGTVGMPDTIVIFFNKYLKRSDIKSFEEKVKFMLETISAEVTALKERTPKFWRVAENIAHERQMELEKDLINYSHITEDKDLERLLGSFKVTFGFDNVFYLIPTFYKGEGVFQVIGCEDETCAHQKEFMRVYTELFIKENPYYFYPEICGKQEVFKIFVPIAVENRIFSVLYAEVSDKYDRIENKLDILLRISTQLSSKILLRRTQKVLENIGKHMERLSFGRRFRVEITDNAPGVLMSEEIARFLGAHGITIWIFNNIQKKFQLIGVSDANLRNLLQNTQKLKSFYDIKELPFVREIWETGKIVKWPKDVDQLYFNLEYRDRGYKMGFGLASEFRMTSIESGSQIMDKKELLSVIITVWSKFDKFDLGVGIKKIIKYFVDYIAGLISVKFTPLYQANIFELKVTSLYHEIKSPLYALNDLIEYAKYTVEQEEFPVNLKRLKESIVKDAPSYLHRTLLFFDMSPLISRILRDEEIQFKQANQDIPHKYQFFSDIVNRLKRIFYAYLKERNLELKFEYSEDFPKYVNLTTNKFTAINAILYNLIFNAIKYSHPETTITIEGKMVYEKAGKKCITVRVKNFGIGIPLGEEEKIFDKGYRGSNVYKEKSKEGGDGYGLYISKQLIKAIGGELKVEKNTNPTIFQCKFPGELFLNW